MLPNSTVFVLGFFYSYFSFSLCKYVDWNYKLNKLNKNIITVQI